MTVACSCSHLVYCREHRASTIEKRERAESASATHPKAQGEVSREGPLQGRGHRVRAAVAFPDSEGQADVSQDQDGDIQKGIGGKGRMAATGGCPWWGDWKKKKIRDWKKIRRRWFLITPLPPWTSHPDLETPGASLKHHPPYHTHTHTHTHAHRGAPETHPSRMLWVPQPGSHSNT